LCDEVISELFKNVVDFNAQLDDSACTELQS